MKNKTKTYLLLILVLGIWGIIGYKIMATVNPAEPDIGMRDFNTSFTPKKIIKIDTFSIKITNRDPFFGTLLIKKVVNKKAKIKKTPELVWMPIIYHGRIQKKDSKTKVFIVSINGQQYIMKTGQIISEVKLVKGTSKTIVVSYKGARKSITKG